MAVISQIKVGSTTYDLKATWDNIANKPINLKAYSGSLSTGGWAQLNGKANSPSIAIAYNSAAASWNSAAYSASLVFGCSDTRGLLDLAYNTPTVTFGGTSFGGATDDNPKWYFKLNGTSAQSYTLPTASKTLAASDGSNASGTWGISVSGNAGGITDAGDSRTLTAAYSKADLAYADYSWLAAWNGNELRAVAKSQFAASTEVISRKAWWTSGNGNNVDTLRGGVTFAYTNHNAPATGTIASFDCSTNENYSLQLMGGYNDNTLFFRSRNGDNGTWHGWRAVTPMSAENGYWGLKTAGGGEDWIRTTQNGLIPYRSGGSGSGHGGLGTSSWYFSSAYIDSVYVTSGAAGFKCRNISYGTANPSGGANGDVYIQY